MRQLKFRAWDGERMRYDVTGFEHGRGNEMAGVFLSGNYYAMADKNMVTHRDTLYPPAHVMHFTGIMDADGNEIYEGDIIQSSYGIPPVKVTAPVVFRDGGFFVMTPRHTPEKCLLSEFINYLGCVYVVGNVHENLGILER